MRGEQPGRLEARLAQHLGQHLELVREVRRVDQHRLTARAQRDCVRLPEGARHHERVLVDGDYFQATPRSLAASRRFLTSSVGFFWFDSSLRPWRLTQMTGIFSLMHGSTSASYPEAMWIQPFLPPIRRAHSLKCAGSGLYERTC